MKTCKSRVRQQLLSIACTCLAAAFLVPSPAVADGHVTWWFQRKNALPYTPFRDLIKPLSGVPSVVSTGIQNGKHWYVVAYIGKPAFDHGRQQVTVMTLIGSLSSNPAGSEGAALYGLPQPAWVTTKNARGLQSWFESGDDPAWKGGPWIMKGAVARNVARLVIVSKPDTSGKRTTTQVPLKQVAAVGYGIRAFALPLYPDDRIDTISAYTSKGKLLDRYTNRSHPSGP